MIIVNKKKRIVAKVLDSLGWVVASLLQMGRGHREKPSGIKKILAVRLAYIGDVVMTVPAIKPLSEIYPGARITFLTGSKAVEVFEHNPYVDEIINYDAPWFYRGKAWSLLRDYARIVRKIRAEKFDMVIDFRGDFRNIIFLLLPSAASWKVGYDITGGAYVLDEVIPYRGKTHKMQFHIDIIRHLSRHAFTPDVMNLYPSVQERNNVQRQLERLGVEANDFLVGIHPGGRAILKSWDAGSYGELAGRLIDQYNARILITGGPDEVELGNRVCGLVKDKKAVNLCGMVTLRELQVVMKLLKLFVTNDTAVLHIASGVDTPTVAIFGPSEVWDTGPLSSRYRVVVQDVDCREACDTYRCQNKNYHECLASITPDQVYEACTQLLGTP